MIETARATATPIAWFDQYVSLLVETVLTLMTKYGVGLEAHLQNMSFEFMNGMPTSLHVRDFGGLRIDASRVPEWLELSNALTNATTEGMYEKVQNTLISNHLNTLVHHFSEDYAYDPNFLWLRINRTFKAVFEDLLSQDIQHTEADIKAFYKETINEKALLTMRVSNKDQDIYIPKPTHFSLVMKLKFNPYHRFVSSQFIARTIDWVDIIALNWITLQMTGSAVYIAYINFARLMPQLAFAFIIGKIIDTVNSTKLMYIIHCANMLFTVCVVYAFGKNGISTSYCLLLWCVHFSKQLIRYKEMHLYKVL